MKADFYITYHHGDEMAARWIAAELKQARFTTLSDSWDFLRGETAIEKIDSMFIEARFAMILISRQFIESLGNSIVETLRATSVQKKVLLVRIDSCEIEKVLGDVDYIDLAGKNEKEAVETLRATSLRVAAVGAAVPGEKETEPLPVAPLTPDEILAKRKQELDQLLDSCIKHNYHMKLDLEQEVEKEVEVKNEETGKKEKRKQWVWEPVPLETVLKDGKNYILVNPSGMGKTTFLTYVTCALLGRDAHYPFLPLFFTCIGLNNRDGSIENFIRNLVESIYTHSKGSLISREWENLCVLIDALDQARDVDDIVSSLLLHDKPLHYKKAKIILSSRQNTADKVKEGFEKIRLKLPEADEVQHYLGEENYKKLEGIIGASGELVKAPVLLEMLKTITEKGHVVSTLTNRADLYTEFTKILLDQERSKPRFWQDRLSIRHFIDYELEQALEKIAFFSLADNEILEIPKEKLVQYCESPEKKEALLNIGIILELFEDREQKIVFRHQSFQAYFAARYIYNQQPEIFRDLVSDIAFFYNDVWYEVMRFFMGLEKDLQKGGDIISPIYQTEDKKDDLNQVLRLIFAVSLMSETHVSGEFVQRVYEQLVDLIKRSKQYLDFFVSNIDKFNKDNDEQRRSFILNIELLLRDKNKDVKIAAAQALVIIGTAKDIPFLEHLLKDEEYWIRHIAAEALGKLVRSGGIPLLDTLIRDKDSYIRRTAANALGNIGTAKDILLLKPLLRDKNEDVRSAAVDALKKIITAQDIPLLQPLLRNKNKYVRLAAIKVLGMIGTKEHHLLLVHLFKDNDKDVRIALFEALMDIFSDHCIRELRLLLFSEDKYVSSAAHALSKIGSSEHIPLLNPLLNHKNQSVRLNTAFVLGEIGTAKHVPLLEPLLRDNDQNVRRYAAEALGNIGTTEHFSIMASMLRNETWRVSKAAAEGLVKIVTAKDIPFVESLLGDKEYWLRAAGAESLGKIGNIEHIPLLRPLLRKKFSDDRYAAANAIGKIGTAQDIPLLKPLLRDKDEYVHHAAFKAIESIYKRSTPKLRIDRVLPKKKEKKVSTVQTFSAKSLHILHISDIHYALEKDPTITCIFHEFLQDIKKWRDQQNNTNIHAICLTGDIAQSGQENQYHSINEKINAILNVTGCPKENLFIIPGNHDVQEYDKISPQGKTLLEQARDNQMNIDTDALSDFEMRREFQDKFSNYYKFIENAGYLNSLPDNHNDKPKPWYNRKLKNFPVRIMGLNSALFCLKDFCQYGNIRMGTDQFHEAFFQGKGNVGDMPENELVILLTHHPINWLVEKESEDYSTLMERHSIIHLHGHIHKTHIEKKQRMFSSSGGYVSIGTGSLYGEKGTEDINTYHIITLDFEKQELHVWARRWNPDSGKWTVYDDDGNNRFPLPTNYSN